MYSRRGPVERVNGAQMPGNQLQQRESELRDIHALSRIHATEKVQTHLAAAASAVTETAGEINDRLYLKEERARRQRARQERDGTTHSAATDDADDETLENLRDKTVQLTTDMEEKMRALIDAGFRVETTNKVLDNAKAALSRGHIARESTQGLQARQSMSRQRRVVSDGDDEDSDGDSPMPDTMTGAANGQQEPKPGLVAYVEQQLQQENDKYEAEHPRTKYASHNDYIGFKRIIHDAANPGEDAPPVPHPDTWFPSASRTLEEPNGSGSSVPAGGDVAASANAAAAYDDDDDVAIARENISLQCPLTLIRFKDPVTSRKCPHSFEREAIMTIISESRLRVEGTRKGLTEQAVKCPVCEKMLSKADLQPNPILVRRVKRLEQMEHGFDGEGDGDDDDDDVPLGTQQNAPQNLDDSHISGLDPESRRQSRAANIKREAAAVAAAATRSSRSSRSSRASRA